MENYTGLRVQVDNIVLGSEVFASTPAFSILENEDYVLQWKQINHNSNTVMDRVKIDFGGTYQNLDSLDVNTCTTVNNINGKAEKLCVIKFKASKSSNLAKVVIGRTLKSGDSVNIPLFDLRHIKVNKGINISSWSENDEDKKAIFEELKTAIEQTAKEISLKASSSEIDILNNILSKAYAEIKVQAKEIALKVEDSELLSSINIKTSGIQIQSESVNVRGVFTTYDPNKPHVRYITVADGFLHLYKNTSVEKPSMSLGYWGEHGTVPYISIGRDDAWNTSASGMLYMTSNEDDYSEDYRLEYSRLSRDGKNTICRSNVHFKTDGTMGYNTFIENKSASNEYSHEFDGGVSVIGDTRCNDARVNNVVGRNAAVGIWGQGEWGGVSMDSMTGNFSPMYDGYVSLGSEGLRFFTAHLQNAPSVTSDVRMKENIRYLDDVNPLNKSITTTTKDMYDFVKDTLKLTTFDYKEKSDELSANNNLGFIAQDLLGDKIGDLILNSDTDVLSYKIGNYINVLAGALQVALKKIDKLEKIIESR